jgi:hypothetical protein
MPQLPTAQLQQSVYACPNSPNRSDDRRSIASLQRAKVAPAEEI